jgi:hypothetical protein
LFTLGKFGATERRVLNSSNFLRRGPLACLEDLMHP